MSVPSPSAQDVLPGVHGCSAKCDCCSYMKKDINQYQNTINGNIYKITQSLSCKTSSVIYIIECKRCHAQFVEKTTSPLKARFSIIKNSIIKKQNRLLPDHFNNNEHTLSDLMIFPVEQVNDAKQLKKRREQIELCLQRKQSVDVPYNMDVHPRSLMNDEDEQGTSSHPVAQAAAETCKRKHPGGDPKTPKKKKKGKKRQSVFSPETEQRLSACEDAISDAKRVVSEISRKQKNISCQKSESEVFLENLRQKTMVLEAENPFEKIYIGLFGRTGAGKSSLINAIVNKDILPASDVEACTSVCVHVEATEDDRYRAEIEFISKEDWESELRYLFEVLSSDRRGAEADDGDEDGEFKDIAGEKIKALYGDDGLKKNYNQLMGNKKVADIVGKCKKVLTFASAEELYENISCYIRSDSNTEQGFWPLVKCVTIYVPDCPALPEGVVLVDLPGAGDANRQRDEMWKESINKCASVWIVNDIHRALSDKEGHSIFQSSLRSIGGGGECHNITFICTKTDIITPKETKRKYKINDEQLEIDQYKDSPNYKTMEKQACILYRNDKVKEDFKKRFKHQVEEMLLGELDDSDSYFNVFTVSSGEYKTILDKDPSTLEPEETEIPLLMEHIKKLYVSHFEKKLRGYLTEVSGVVSFLHLYEAPFNPQFQHFFSGEYRRLEKDLSSYCQVMDTFLTDIEEKLQTSLDEGVREAERHCLGNARKILEPAGKNFRGYHRTLKAMCRNDGYFRSSNGDIVDLNYTLSQSMYAKMNTNNTFVKTFSPRNLRNSINGQLESFHDNFISISSLEDYKKAPEKYRRLVYIKTQSQCIKDKLPTVLQWYREIHKQRKLLNYLEQEILQRKKHIYNSVGLSVQKTLKPVYSEFGGADKYTLEDIQDKVNETIRSFKHVMFRQAKDEMLRLFNDLRTWIVEELKTQMITAMRVALQQTPDDFINVPDVGEESEAIKRSCDSLDIKIFV